MCVWVCVWVNLPVYYSVNNPKNTFCGMCKQTKASHYRTDSVRLFQDTTSVCVAVGGLHVCGAECSERW